MDSFDLSMLCADCNWDTNIFPNREYYMVTEKVWSKAGSPEGYLCIACLETRIGRKLNARDFTDCNLNWQIACGTFSVSERLLQRILLTAGRQNKFVNHIKKSLNGAVSSAVRAGHS